MRGGWHRPRLANGRPGAGAELLAGILARYRRPIFLAGTSIEGEERAAWMRYIGEEVRAAIRAGTPIEGNCAYPMLSHPCWDDDRYRPNGLMQLRPGKAPRPVDRPLAADLAMRRALFQALCGAP